MEWMDKMSKINWNQLVSSVFAPENSTTKETELCSDIGKKLKNIVLFGTSEV